MGACEAYPIEYFAVLEQLNDFEENGLHWHLLVKSVDFFPHEGLKGKQIIGYRVKGEGARSMMAC